jgi:hypothetical protein
MERVTAVFADQASAERAVSALRAMGVADAHLSFVSRHGAEGSGAAAAAADDAGDAAAGAGKGLLAGASVGALFGLAAALIPGVGPFITAGWLASALGTAAGGAAAGAIVGGTSGAIAGAFAKAGYSEDEANYYGSAVEKGNVLVAVDTSSGYAADQVRSVLSQHGGMAYSP